MQYIRVVDYLSVDTAVTGPRRGTAAPLIRPTLSTFTPPRPSQLGLLCCLHHQNDPQITSNAAVVIKNFRCRSSRRLLSISLLLDSVMKFLCLIQPLPPRLLTSGGILLSTSSCPVIERERERERLCDRASMIIPRKFVVNTIPLVKTSLNLLPQCSW